jgi:choline dehydrogenase-like flavoprotein
VSIKTLSSNPYIEGLIGVVDPECRVFGCNNLYISGSAVFPTASFVNPTMTIVALAYRMADDLKKRLA